MNPKEKRLFTRNASQVSMRYSANGGESYVQSTIVNSSAAGCYFESQNEITRDQPVSILMSSYKPGSDGPEAFLNYQGKVRWCRKLSNHESHPFGVGVILVTRSHAAGIEMVQPINLLCDICEQSVSSEAIYRIDDRLRLCPECKTNLTRTPDFFKIFDDSNHLSSRVSIRKGP